jgi:hypothetical protein
MRCARWVPTPSTEREDERFRDVGASDRDAISLFDLVRIIDQDVCQGLHAIVQGVAGRDPRGSGARHHHVEEPQSEGPGTRLQVGTCEVGGPHDVSLEPTRRSACRDRPGDGLRALGERVIDVRYVQREREARPLEDIEQTGRVGATRDRHDPHVSLRDHRVASHRRARGLDEPVLRAT